MAKMKKRHYSSGGDVMREPSERKLEARDMGMLSEDHSAIANMPQNVVYRAWPKNDAYLYSQLDDGISGIDMEQKEAVRKLNGQKAKSMY